MPKRLHERGPRWNPDRYAPSWPDDPKEFEARKKSGPADFSRDMKVGPYNSRPVKKYHPSPSLESQIKAAKRSGWRPLYEEEPPE